MHKKAKPHQHTVSLPRKGTSQNLQIGLEESFDFIERNDIYLVI